MAKGPSLRRRLLFWLLPSTFVLALCWLWAAYAIVIHFVNVAYDRSLEDTVETIAEQVKLTGDGFAVDLSPSAKRMLEFDRFDRIYYGISDESNRNYLRNMVLPGPGSDAPNSHGSIFYDAIVNGAPVRIVQTSVRNPSGRQLDVRVAETRQKRKILAHEVMTYMVAPQSFFLAGIILLIWIGVGRGVAPLARVRDAIARLDPTDLRQIEESMLPAELEEQISVINDLVARLADAMSAQQRLIADASHQLRTPITNIRLLVELALRTGSFEEMREVLGKIDSSSNRLVRLTEQLLALNRIEAHDPKRTRFDNFLIDEAVADAVAWAVPAAIRKNIDIQVHVPPQATVFYGDRHAIEQLVSNLVDNAILYTSVDGRVSVNVTSDGSMIRLLIEDNGPGIAEEDRERVMERFDRGRHSSEKGAGLGLSIAREVARLHHGHLTLASAVPNGLRVEVSLPSDCRAE